MPADREAILAVLRGARCTFHATTETGLTRLDDDRDDCAACDEARADAVLAAISAALRRARADALRTAADAVQAFTRIAPDRAGAYMRLLANAADEGLDIAEHAARLRRLADDAEAGR